MDERTALLALSLVPGIGSALLHRLVEAYDQSATAAWHGRRTWSERAGIAPQTAGAAAAIDPRQIDLERRRLDALKARIVIRTDEEYPPGLLSVARPAPVLFVRGRLPTDHSRCIAIVGTRRPSAAGERTSDEIASQLAAVGLGIVSGLALGIDGAAHRGALKVGGFTVAVLGCGLDHAYPSSHVGLMEQVAETGAVVTEYPLGTQPLPRHFPARNRIIAGLSAGVLLVESGRSGGALHTVEYALGAGREVMAVPGDVCRWQSEAPNQLIKDGAVLVRNAADVLHVLGYTSWPPATSDTSVAATLDGDDTAADHASDVALPAGARALGQSILYLLKEDGAQGVDELRTQLTASVGSVAAALTWLEVTGQIARVPGGRFRTLA